MATIRERIADDIEIEHEQLTDGSVAYNVLVDLDYDDPYARRVKIGCGGIKQAKELAEILKVVAFVELLD